MPAQTNSVELIGIYGDDLSVAKAAWASTGNESDDLERVNKLVLRLAHEGHHTPFEHNLIKFNVTSDIATHIHFLKHRHVSINSRSARYKEFREDVWYTPTDWPEDLVAVYNYYLADLFETYHMFIEDLVEYGFTRQRAKESARFILPYGTSITYQVTFNFRSFMHFLGLRMSDKAQKEVHDLASEMLRLVRETHKFDTSLAGFGYGD